MSSEAARRLSADEEYQEHPVQLLGTCGAWDPIKKKNEKECIGGAARKRRKRAKKRKGILLKRIKGKKKSS